MLLSAMAPAFADGEKGYREYTAEEYTALNLSAPLRDYGQRQALIWAGGPAVENRLDISPSKYLFKTDSADDAKEYILLKSVNAGENDGYFVLVNTYTDTSEATQYNTEIGKYYFDVLDSGSIAYKMNTDEYMSAYFPLMKDYINEHTWYTEPTSRVNSVPVNAYSTVSKIALPSMTEYRINADRIGIGIGTGFGSWWSRTPHTDKSRIWFFNTSSKDIEADHVTSTSKVRGNRPCFYLNEEFFANVKIDESYITADSEIANILKKFDLETLRNVGYSDKILVMLGVLKGSTELASVSIEGETQAGCELTVKYELTEGFEQTEYTKFTWEYSDEENGEFTEISGADGKTFTVGADLNKKYIRASVMLGNSDGCGEKVYSDAVYINTLAPVVENVKISGSAFTGGKLTVTFDTASGAVDTEKSRVIWYWTDKKDGELNVIDGANGFEYTVEDYCGDKFITASVIPANFYDIFGDEVKSSDFIHIITAVDESKLETKLTNINSSGEISSKYGIEILDTVTPEKYAFTIAKGVKSESGAEDKKEYILLKSVNAKDGDGYFVMVGDGALDTTQEGTAVNALESIYPGTYNGDDQSIIAKNYQQPTRAFDPTNEKSIAYYLNKEDYMKSQFPVMYEGGYINDHTWYTEQGILENGEIAYAANSKIALISVTEYLQNAERISPKVKSSSTWGSSIFQTRTPHPTNETAKYNSGMYTAPCVWHFASKRDAKSYANAESVVYLFNALERPVFYLDESFFRNVKVETGANSAVADVLKELMPYEDMLKMGYTEKELTKMGISKDYPTGKNASLKGIFTAGNLVWSDYEFSHTDKTKKEGNTKYQCYISNGNGFDKLDGETNPTYILKTGDVGKKLMVEITPYDEDGNMAKTISAVSKNAVSAETDISFTGFDLGGITDVTAVQIVNANVKIKASKEANIKLCVGIYDKNTNKCIAVNPACDVTVEAGEKDYPVSVSGFSASDGNYIKLLAISEDVRPLFGIDCFRR